MSIYRLLFSYDRDKDQFSIFELEIRFHRYKKLLEKYISIQREACLHYQSNNINYYPAPVRPSRLTFYFVGSNPLISCGYPPDSSYSAMTTDNYILTSCMCASADK
jgi:hypothetical protein